MLPAGRSLNGLKSEGVPSEIYLNSICGTGKKQSLCLARTAQNGREQAQTEQWRTQKAMANWPGKWFWVLRFGFTFLLVFEGHKLEFSQTYLLGSYLSYFALFPKSLYIVLFGIYDENPE